MSLELVVTLTAVFASVALVTASIMSWAISWRSPERQRLRQLARRDQSALLADTFQLDAIVNPVVRRIARLVPKSPGQMSRVERRLATAGYRGLSAIVLFQCARALLPLACAGAVLLFLGVHRGWMFALFAAAVGFMLPGLFLDHKLKQRKKQIRNGLPDALDLLIVCLEAGSGLDQAIAKASEELEVSYPALSDELRLITTEVRAGKPRLEAFKNFAQRTKVDDVRALVAMLVQTDRFGTSVAQALRTHAATSRTKRRQRAEERAAKVGVKLVFPLVMCLFPAFYVVTLGPAIIQFIRVFFGQVVHQFR